MLLSVITCEVRIESKSHVKLELKVIIVRHFVLFASIIGLLAEKLLVGISKVEEEPVQTVANSFNIYLSHNFFLMFTFTLALGHTQPPTQWIRGVSPRGKSAGTWSCTHLQIVPRPRKRGLYIYSPIRLHGVLPNYFSKGTSIPYLGFLDIFNSVF
jgi:hypothetical protein